MIFRTDGTPAGTRPASNDCADSPCGPDSPFDAVRGALYFTTGGWLYRLNDEGELLPLQPMRWSGHYFAAETTPILFRGCQEDSCHVWVTDGTSTGTHQLDSELGSLSGAEGSFQIWHNRVHFINAARQLISTDGTAAGTRFELEVSGYHPRLVLATGSQLFYVADDVPDFSDTAKSLYARDDTGISRLLTSEHELPLLGRLGEKAFFGYDIGGHYYLAACGGTPGGCSTLMEVTGNPHGAQLGNLFYFPFRDALWRSDGTAAGTDELTLGLTQPRSSWATPFASGSQLIVAMTAGSGRPMAPWQIDPQTLARQPLESTERALEILTGDGQILFAENSEMADRPLVSIHESEVTDLPATKIGGWTWDDRGHLFFTDYTPGQEVWESDGTVAGTRELFDLKPGWMPCQSPHPCILNLPSNITPSGDRVYFSLLEGYNTFPWVWDRTRGEAHQIEAAGTGRILTAITGSRALLVTDNPQALWLTDGTTEGTYTLFSLPENSTVTLAKTLGTFLFFVSPYHGALWSFDLGGVGPNRLAEGPVDQMVVSGKRLFFLSGNSLGVTDGTAAGTHVCPLQSPAGAAFIRGPLFALRDGRVVFSALDDGGGEEVWISDGTALQTYRLTDLAPGTESASPSHFAQLGNRLFFQGDNGATGRELWALDLPPLPPCLDRLCLLDDRFEVEITAFTEVGAFPGRLAVANGDSGVFSFFSENNWEMLVKVLDGCAINGKRWVFAAAATDVAWTLTIRERQTGDEKVYRNPAGEAARAITDSEAFPCR